MSTPETPLYRLTAVDALALLKSGKVTVEEYAKSLLSRVAEKEPDVKAWAYLNPELVLAEARKLDAVPADQRGPLHGLAVGVKDVILTKDMPTQHNSEFYKDSAPELDAACVQTLRNAGALIMGKTHTTEFATCVTGPVTCNPRDLARTPGGSSSGSGAAVADFHCPLALGTQTGGSTIRPGAFNGIYSFKPTWGAVSREGLKIYSISNDTLGLLARTADDLKLLADVFQLTDDEPAAPVALKGAKFGYLKTHVWADKAGPGLKAAWEKSKALLTEAGATVEEIELPADFSDIPRLYRAILCGEGRASFISEYGSHGDKLDPLIVSHVLNTEHFTHKDQLEGYDKIAAMRPVLDAIASKYTALVTPSVVDEAPLVDSPLRITGDASFCLMWSILHTPVINVPGFAGEHGLPIGLSIVGPRYHDEHLVAVAKAVGTLWQAKGGFVDKL